MKAEKKRQLTVFVRESACRRLEARRKHLAEESGIEVSLSAVAAGAIERGLKETKR